MKQKILVLGTGSAAYRHVKNILKIKGIAEINVYSNLKNRSKVFCERFNKAFINVADKKDIYTKNYSHIVIASNTASHNMYLKKFILKKNNIYCEKPLPNDKYLETLKKLVKQKNLSNKVKFGYQFRFNYLVKFLKGELSKKVNKNIYLIKIFCGQNLKKWRINSDYKKLYSAGKNYLASVNWELSHEIDILNFIYKKPKKIFSSLNRTKLLDLNINDVSTSIMKFKNKKVICTITSEMLSPFLYRKILIATTNNFYEADLVNNSLIVTNAKNVKKKYYFKQTRNDMFLKLMKSFLLNKKKSNTFDFANLNDALDIANIQKKMEISNNRKTVTL
tara:strand:- start:2652 stop:3653 length:1002 start_codon:yes stop_codon:yes gene_type:complete